MAPQFLSLDFWTRPRREILSFFVGLVGLIYLLAGGVDVDPLVLGVFAALTGVPIITRGADDD